MAKHSIKFCFLTVLFGSIITALFPDSTVAQNRSPAKIFERFDTNDDGKISADEWSRSPSGFKRIDKNGDNFLTIEEFTNFIEARRAKRQGGAQQQRQKNNQRANQNNRNGDSDTNAVATRVLEVWKGTVEDNRAFKSAIVLAHRGQIVAKEGIRTTVETPMSVASISKSFTGACAWEAMKQGLLTENTRLGEIFGPRLEGIDLNNPARANLTIGGLLSQTAGIGPDHTQRGAYSSYYGTSEPQNEIIAQRALRGTPHKPGEFYYTNENFNIFAMAIETLTKESYESYCKKAVFQPIGASSARRSDYWGYLSASAGWQISALDLAKFTMHYANLRKGLGAEIKNLKTGTMNEKLKYSMGMILRMSKRGISYISHSGHLNGGDNRRDGGFYVSTRNGWVLALTGSGFSKAEGRNFHKKLGLALLGRK